MVSIQNVILQNYVDREFETLGTHVLKECYMADPDKAMMIVERKSQVWANMTTLQIAAVAKDQVT